MFCQQRIHLKIVPWDSREVATMLIVYPKARVKQAENEKSSFQQAISLGNYCSAQTTSPFCLVADFKSNKVNVVGKENSPVINLSPHESTQPSRKVQLLYVLKPQNEGKQSVVQGLDSSFRYQTRDLKMEFNLRRYLSKVY